MGHVSLSPRPYWSSWLTRALAILITLVLEAGWLASGISALGYPLYPDLITSSPSGLYIERGPDGKYLLRFANTAANLGGRLEIAVGAGTRDLYQNVYDQWSGGSLVVHQKIGADLIYHPEHNHFHFEGFAKYELLKRDSAGYYRTTSRTGSKTTYCILDSVRVSTNGPSVRQYDACGDKVQGMSAGWGDVYIASLFGQWIDLGTSSLADGSYAIRSTADPDNKLTETNDFNNVGHTYFNVVNGRIAALTDPPTCGLETLNLGAMSIGSQTNASVGATVALSCARFGIQEPVDIYWGSVNTKATSTVTSTDSGQVFAEMQIPRTTIGVHYIIARGRTSGAQVASVVNVVPSIQVSPRRAAVGSTVLVDLSGFSASETVAVRVYKSPNVALDVGLAVVGANGSGQHTFALPAMPFGGHIVEAIGVSSGASTRGSVTALPSLTTSPEEIDPGGSIGIALRGFAIREQVQIRLGADGPVLGTVSTSHSGSTVAGSTQVQVPESVAPGTYQVMATGLTSHLRAAAELTVRTPEPTDAPPPTPSLEASPVESPSATPGDPTPTGTATAVLNSSPIALAPSDQTVVDEGGDGSERVLLDGGSSTDPEGDTLTFKWSITEVGADGNPVTTLLSTDTIADLTLEVGVYPIDLTVTDQAGNTDFDAVIVRIDPPPQVSPTPPT